MKAAAPSAWLGLLGGGQLGRMFCMAAQSMGYKVVVIDPSADSPAGSVADDHIAADYLDAAALSEVARRCVAVTTEFENVPAEALQRLAKHCVVSPSAASVSVAQDRIKEKRFLVEAGLVTAPFAVIEKNSDLDDVEAALLPGILKRARFGYDGKGQARVSTIDEAKYAFQQMGAEPCVLEQRLPLETEVSVVVARGFDNAALTFPVAENTHANGILDVSVVPARLPETVLESAKRNALRVAEALDYHGVLCVEFFVLQGGRLVANEIAPRPHNSGHYTIDACVTSQFEQQARIMCGLPLGDTELLAPAVMVNLLGDLWAAGEPNWLHVLSEPRAKLHLYGKSQARPGRKMGHFTVLADNVNRAVNEAQRIKAALERDASKARQSRTA